MGNLQCLVHALPGTLPQGYGTIHDLGVPTASPHMAALLCSFLLKTHELATYGYALVYLILTATRLTVRLLALARFSGAASPL